MKIIAASFDIGKCNFAQYIEKFKTEDVGNNIDDVATSGKRLQTGVYDFTDGVGGQLTDAVRLEMLEHLNKYIKIWDKCDIFLIEQQYYNVGFRRNRGVNLDAIKVAEILYTWFLGRYPCKTVMYFGSKHKTKIFDTKKMDKKQRKTWAVEHAEKYYTDRGDEDMVNLYKLSRSVKGKRINTEERAQTFRDDHPMETPDVKNLAEKVIWFRQKLDDTSDAFMQLQAFKYLTLVKGMKI